MSFCLNLIEIYMYIHIVIKGVTPDVEAAISSYVGSLTVPHRLPDTKKLIEIEFSAAIFFSLLTFNTVLSDAVASVKTNIGLPNLGPLAMALIMPAKVFSGQSPPPCANNASIALTNSTLFVADFTVMGPVSKMKSYQVYKRKEVIIGYMQMVIAKIGTVKMVSIRYLTSK